MFTGDGENLIVGGSMEDRDTRIAVVDLNNGREMANKEFTGNLRNYHPVGKSDVGYLINQGVFGSGVNKFVTRIWDWRSGSERTLFDGQGQEGGINWSLLDKRREYNCQLGRFLSNPKTGYLHSRCLTADQIWPFTRRPRKPGGLIDSAFPRTRSTWPLPGKQQGKLNCMIWIVGPGFGNRKQNSWARRRAIVEFSPDGSLCWPSAAAATLGFGKRPPGNSSPLI